jgi:hypothetical protein
LGVCEFYVGIGKLRWFRESRCLNQVESTFDKRNAAFDNAFGLFVEGQPIGSDTSVNSCSIEKALDHAEESCSGGKGIRGRLPEPGHALTDGV